MRNVENIYPLSPLQEGMLFHSLLGGGDGVYVNQFECVLRGDLDPPLFREAWSRVVHRHQALRAAFLWEGLDQPLQAVRRRVELPWSEEDWREVPGVEADRRLAELRRRHRHEPLPLDRAPLMRFALVRRADDAYDFLWTFHHILLDGWSTPLLLGEIGGIYEALAEGREPSLGAVAQYRDYVAWLKHRDLGDAEGHWRRYLEGFTAPTPLSVDRPTHRSDAARSGLEEHGLRLPADQAMRLRRWLAAHQLTWSTVLHGAWALLLARYAGVDDVVFGSVASGRPADLPGVESIVGLFINTLPARVRTPAQELLIPWLQELQRELAEVRRYESTPLLQVQKWSEIPAGTPLFESILVFENYPAGDGGAGRRSRIALTSPRALESTNYPLTLQAGVSGDSLSLRATVDRGRIAAVAARRLLRHLSRLLTGMAERPEARLGDLPILTRTERHQRLEWNDTAVAYAPDATLHGLIAARAAAVPERVAVEAAGSALSYWELDRRARELAAALAELGCGPEERVAVLLERSLAMSVGLLGVLQAGAAYVPLDPDHPAERLAFVLADSGARAVLTQDHLVSRVPESAVPALVLDGGGRVPCGARAAIRGKASPVVDPASPAYVLYTSGSTGRPKGAAIAHRSIANRLLWMQETFRLAPDDRVLQKTPFSFDVSLWELFWPLLAGSRLVMARPGSHRDDGAMVRAITRHRITTVHFVPSMLRPFLAHPAAAECTSLKRCVVSGEALDPDLVERFVARLPAELHNLYGPTEAAVDVTAWPCRGAAAGEPVPIGRPIANTRILLLDRALRQAPARVPAEVLIGGVNLARGYPGRPALTAERFIPEPGAGEPGGRLYRTGDLGRHREDGAVEFVGRIDFQVKLRGFRIELGEIEATLLEEPGVGQAAVVMDEREDGHRRLLGYVVGSGERPPDAAALRTALQERLPDYMVPAHVLILPELPVTPSGKLDRRALPRPEPAGTDARAPYTPPRNEAELTLSEIWADVLKVERVGIDDDFFGLGGDSILSLRILSRARDRGIDLDLPQLFQHPTIRRLARELRARAGSAERVETRPFGLLAPEDRQRLPPGVEDAYPVARLQAGMLFHGELGAQTSTYHNTVSVHLRAAFDRGKLEAALRGLAERHPALRTSFDLSSFGEPLQLVHADVEIPLEVDDFRGLDPGAQEAALDRWFEQETRRLFDWRRPPLVRFHAHRRSDDRFQLSWSEHHAILDGWSIASMISELAAHYVALLRGPERTVAGPAPPATSYHDFVALERQVLASDEARRFWEERLRGATPFRLAETSRGDREPARIQTVNLGLPQELVNGLQALSRASGVPLKSVLFAAHLRVLSFATGREDLVTGLVSNGRLEHEDGDRVLGLFLNTLPLRVRLEGGTWRDLVDAAFAAEREALPFRRFPLAEVQRITGGRPLFDVAFTFMHFHVMESFTRMTQEIEALEARNNIPTDFALSTYFELHFATSRLHLVLDYDSGRISPEVAEAMAGHYRNALEAMVAGPSGRYETCGLLSEAERRRILTEANAAWTDLPVEAPLHELLAARVKESPDAVAVSCGERGLSYRGLGERAARLAAVLRRLGVGPEVRVAVLLDRSLELVVAICAVVEAGGAYVPLDPAAPAERLSFILSDAAVAVLVTNPDGAGTSRAWDLPTVILDGDRIAAPGGEQPGSRAPVPVEGLAYVIYTSGSTGTPKGVAMPHDRVVRLFRATDGWYGFDDSMVWTFFHTPAFDVSVWEMWGALLHGGQLLMVPYLTSRSPDEFLRLLVRERVTVLSQTPSAFRQLVAAATATAKPADLALRFVVFGGEALEPAALSPWFERQGDRRPRLVNMYGITETTVHVTYRPIDRADAARRVSPIGRPMPDLATHVLDSRLGPVPIGTPGELVVGGAGLARGYLGRPGLTAARFVPDPFGGRSGARLYRSGDLVRRLPGGELEYLARIDRQVKVRGFRIELAEIESALREHPFVSEAVVDLRDDGSGEGRIVAYVVPRTGGAAGDRTDLIGDQVDHWRTVFDDTFDTGAGRHGAGFDISGWTSSYTGDAIPESEMREWVDATLDRVLSFSPAAVLEIGCGTGLLASRLAPRCERYWATDFSEAALAVLRTEIGDLPGVRLLRREASSLEGVPEASFDLVVINSVVQYFPSAEYLVEVLDLAIRAVRDGGQVFVGDVRSLGLGRLFHASVELHRAPASAPVEEVRRRVGAALSAESELLVAPALFQTLADVHPRLTGVRVLLKKGRAGNEMNRFRYDVLLAVGGGQRTAPVGRHLDWDADALDLGAVRRLLAEEAPEALLVSGMPNARLVREAAMADLLWSLGSGLAVGDLRRAAGDPGRGAVEPDDALELARELGYEAGVTWAGSGDAARFDALLWRGQRAPRWPVSGSETAGGTPEWHRWTNDPLSARALGRVAPELREALKRRLPDYMVPSAFVLIQSLPLTPNGKLDRRALPEPDPVRRETARPYVGPRSSIEETLAQIWRDVLGLDRVGVHDNLFEIGGHSLLATQIMARTREALRVDLPIRTLFTAPTVEGLALAIVQRRAELADADALAAALDEVEGLAPTASEGAPAERRVARGGGRA
jgi:amino acid adenylation domain-containing protein